MVSKIQKNGEKNSTGCCSACASMKCMSCTALGLSVGITWGFVVFIMGIAAMHWMPASDFVSLFMPYYPGYDATVVGALIGAAWGFFYFFLLGLIIGCLYNWFKSKWCCPFHCRNDRTCCK